ncbi:hypothetical protein BGZ95_011853 [Linnemannia exigua]|uniref:PB1 domain-containing protein n=1 Tax=Linnemannia exigua TaxID=604196 RepID=A0AAD4D9U2_9FUNG|nr:hypothetical protein BGZ95_011853 [Linnemannia exigua]
MSDSQNLSPCKVNFNGALRRFLIARPAVWSDFELKLRNVYGLPVSAAIDVQYKDEEGDVISLNTDSELEDVLAMHALFTQIAPVRFDVSLRDGEVLPAIDNNYTNTVAATANTPAVDAVEPYNVTQATQRERSNTVTSNTTSDDDGSLIEFEEAQETNEPIVAASTESTLNQSISYPQNDLYEATLRQEQEMIEAQKLQAPFISSSVYASEDDTMDVEEVNNKDEDSNKTSSRRSSKSSSPSVVPVAEFEALRMNSATEVMDSIVASAIEQHAQDVAGAASAHSKAEDEGNADPTEPEIPETEAPHGDRALIEQFQMLIQEFQHVIQSNPQLVTIAGSIMNKILSNVQVNVESFANYLQETAHHAQTSAEEAAASAHEAAAEATRSCPFGAGSENPFLSNPFFAHHRGGRFGRRGHEDPFSGCHDDDAGNSSDRAHHPHGHHHGHHRGGRGGYGARGGRGGCFGREGGNQWSFGSFFPPTPPMPPMPSMPAMPPMPPMPGMPPMPQMAGMPPMPQMAGMPPMPHFFSSEGTSVPNTRPSPFSRGFPFHIGTPSGCKRGNNFRFKGDRPSACDTESGKEGSCEKKKRGYYSDKKDKKSSSSSDEATVAPQQGESSSSAAQQQQPQMTEIGNGWTWTQLPNDATADPSGEASSRHKFGWVWNGGENGDVENPDPSPIYVESGDEEMAEPPQDGSAPFDFGRRGGRGGRGGFFRGGPRGGPRGRHPFAFFPHHPGHFGPHANAHGPHAHGPHGYGPHTHHGPEHAHSHAHNQQYHHHNHNRRHSGSKSAEGGETQHESGSEERLKRRQTYHEQHRQAQEEQRKAQEEQRKVQEEQRKVQQEQRRVQEEQRRARAGAAATAGPIGGGSLAGIWPVTPTTPAIPAAPAVTAVSAAPASARPTSADAAPASARPTFANAAPTSAAPTSARPTTTTTTTAPAAELSNPTMNHNEFREEIRMLTNMGFADTAELRTVVRDFGGEVEAVVEFMISAGHP